jgi:hypothetical protein
LKQVADHQQLYTAEGPIAAPVTSQDAIHAIEQIRPHHTDLIDDQQVEALDDADFVIAEPILGRGWFHFRE